MLQNIKAIKIPTMENLVAILGNNFIVFCGSAISLGMKNDLHQLIHFLPMVGEASNSFYTHLGKNINRSSYIGKIIAGYSFSIARGIEKRRINRKFEEFLWILEHNLTITDVSRLISALYKCENGQFLQNHLAIGSLLSKRHIKLCLTTNFDNAIELASPNVNSRVM